MSETGKVLLTGAPGWLGSRLLDELLRAGRDVRCLVHPAVDASALEKSCEIVRADIRDARALAGSCEGIGSVFHLAAIIHSVRTSVIEEINVSGTRNIVAEAARAGVHRLVFMSSNAAQGSLDGGLMTESGQTKPTSAYGKSKLRCEQIVRAIEGKLLTTTIVRCPMFYGPGQPARMTKLMKIVRGGRPPVFGEGKNLRSMAYVDNVVAGLLLAESSARAAGQTYWLADERPYTTLEVFDAIAAALGVKARPLHLPELIARTCRVADEAIERIGLHSMNVHVVGESIQDIACSIEKARSELGYRPSVEIEEGFRRAVAWCRERGSVE